MFSMRGENTMSLWSVNADGRDRTMLVDGADLGQWQWVP